MEIKNKPYLLIEEKLLDRRKFINLSTLKPYYLNLNTLKLLEVLAFFQPVFQLLVLT